MSQARKIQMLKDALIYGRANYISQALGILNSVLLRRFMGPSAMGIWNVIQVLLGYAGQASLGTTKALARDYPLYIGKGEKEKASHIKDVTYSFCMVMSIVPAVVFAAYLFLNWHTLDTAYRVGVGFLILFLFVQRFYDLLLTLLRSDKEFNVLSEIMIINALGGLIITVLFVYFWNIYGLYIGTAVLTIGCLYFALARKPYQFKFSLDFPEIRQQLKLGLPLIACTFLISFLKGQDKLILAKFEGFHEVGLYSIAMMVNSYISSAPMMFSHIWFPNLMDAYGKRGSAESVRGHLETAVLATSVLLPYLSALAMFAVPIFVHYLIPQFTPGIPAMSIYLVGTYFIILSQFSHSFLVTLDRFLWTVPILIASILVNTGLNIYALKAGHGLAGVAAATSLSFFIYGAGSYALCLKFSCAQGKTGLAGLRVLVIPSVIFSAAFAIQKWVTHENMFAEAAIRFALITLTALPFYFILERRTRVTGHLIDIIFKRKTNG